MQCLAHGMGRIFCFILKLITICTKGKTAGLTLSPFSCQVHTPSSMEGNSITAVPLKTKRLQKQVPYIQKPFLYHPIKKKKVNTSYDLFQLFRSLNERTVKLRFSKCSRACLALRNKYFLRGKAVHFQKTKNIFTGTMTSTVSSYSMLAFSHTHCVGSLSAARCQYC